MKQFVFLFIFLLSSAAFGQQVKEPDNLQKAYVKRSMQIYTEVDTPPVYSTRATFEETLTNKIQADSIAEKGKKTSVITFVIEKNGSMEDIKVSGPNASFNEEVKRAISTMKNRWNTAGKIYGYKVRYQYKTSFSYTFK
ncbi:energy transducer TonB [Chryseobacterium sp. CT-SW4]|uniref:energy transducer TonB n=1 Tax=Chryseobacterium sp. SW-1 TaxID=3157343 RepID=UPI003B0220C4